jgi:hypothetical protein
MAITFEEQGRLDEYKFLRTEMEAIGTSSFQTLSFLIAAVAVVMASSYGRLQLGERQVPLVIGSLLTIGGYHLIWGFSIRSWRIAAYLQRHLEPALNYSIQWETALKRRRENSHKTRDTSIFRSHVLVLHSLNLGVLVAIAAEGQPLNRWSWSDLTLRADDLWLMIPIAVLAYGILKCWHIDRGGKLQREMISSWDGVSVNGIPIAKDEVETGTD